ncbi:S9 family peptidase [Dysgonomonas sp. 521]|uniref:S9 family peptidase n=1 Tax=Dysgonomonas sp. 521 TaxID=2302932 RepID=UPI0013D6A33C|nr:prolyl oligopeptidase family serine peptidase [Dysgonomonas sp. 521]NDV94078.1 S9 family peptidase [Dysgonomonas sp. 521]
MKFKSCILLAGMFIAVSLYPQKKLTISQIYTAPSVTVVNPLKIDSVNLKGESFSEKNLLKMQVTIPGQSVFVRPLKADADGFFYMEKPQENGTTVQLISFYVTSDRFAKGTLRVTTPNMIEIYVDGKLAATKETKESTFRSDKKDITTTISPYPQRSRVVIKLLASAKDEVPPTLKIDIENEKEDSNTTFASSNTNSRFVNFSDMLLGKRVSKVSLSNNGQYALIFYRNTLGEKSITSAELHNVKTGTNMLIDTEGSKRLLAWMPKSEKMFYVSKTDAGTELRTIDPLTMQEAVLAKDIPDESILFSPDERTLFYTKEEKEAENKSDLKLLRSPEDRQPGYGNRSFIYKYDLATGLSQQLTFGSHSTYLNDISADSKQLLISISDETVTKRPFRNFSMYKLDLPAMTVDTLWTKEAFAYGASFSPDGKKVLISGAGEAFGGIGLNIAEGQMANSYNALAFIMDLGTKKIEPITKDFDPSIDAGFWNKKDNLIYFRTTDKDCVNMYTYNPSAKSFSKLPLDEEVIRTFSTADNALLGIYSGVSASNSTKAYLYDLKTQKSTLIADPYKEQLAEMTLGKVEGWNFTNSAGTEITGMFYLPPNFDASKKYPMIVYYYGGTMPTSRTFEGPYPGHVFASQGYVVYVVQPSGATGFGQKFAALHVNAWGKRTAEDIIEGTKQFMKEHSYVDETKIGCIGASYGGFMTMYLQTRTDMFAAAVSHAGISSISSYWGEGYWGYTYSSGASANSYPWNNTDMYVKQSPLFSADKINTPLLLTHGTVDTNVPMGESIQMYTALRILGKPVEFIQVKDENHGVMNYKRRVEWNNSIMAWFSKWLKNDSGWWDNLYPGGK